MSFEEIQDSSASVNSEVQSSNQNFSEKTNINEANFSENDSDRELYEEVLEKLDIKKRKNQQEIQDNSDKKKGLQQKSELSLKKLKNSDKSQMNKQIENSLKQDFSKIQKLMKSGIINSEQGQNLKKQVLKKTFDKLIQTEKINRNLFPALNPKGKSGLQLNALEEFNKANPEFFATDGRKEVLNYLNSGGVSLGQDEINKISEIIRIVEKSAIDGYLKKVNHEKNLINSNEIAKQKLTANAQKSGFNGNLSRAFTREQIGQMNSAEFAKYEPLIMEQLKKGLIR